MAAKAEPSKARYRVIRDVALAIGTGQGYIAVAGEFVVLDPDDAGPLVRDGMLTPAPAEEG